MKPASTESGFASHMQQWHWDDIKLSLYAKRPGDVQQALARAARQQKLTLNDMQALLSPAAASFLEPMAQLAQQQTRQRFGHTMQLYAPLYLSNLCSNICSYCGFSMHNNIRRKTLDMAELERELQALKQLGFDHILLVTGEAERVVGMTYFEQALTLVRQYFSHISMEVQPLEQQQYQQLIALGLDAVLVYQETYQRRSYQLHHKKGRKSDYDYRLATPERLGRAGIDKIGLGCLLGLEDWRVDSFFLAGHLHYLQQRFWQCRFSISFPRLRPCAGGLPVIAPIDDKQLVQLITAFRLFSPTAELSLSTRESAGFRDHLCQLGITAMSAESKTQPGGYSSDSAAALAQFDIADRRSTQQVVTMLQRQGLQVLFKDGQNGFRRAADV